MKAKINGMFHGSRLIVNLTRKVLDNVKIPPYFEIEIDFDKIKEREKKGHYSHGNSKDIKDLLKANEEEE